MGPKGKTPRSASLAADIIKYLGSLGLSCGDCAGEHLDVLHWQRRFTRGFVS